MIIDDYTRELFDMTTLDDIESYIAQAKEKTRDQRRLNAAYQRCIDEDGLQSLVDTLVRIATYAPQETMRTDDPEFWEEFAINAAVWVGGERGMRIGAEAAERMILGARSYARNQVRSFAPMLNDVEPVDG